MIDIFKSQKGLLIQQQQGANNNPNFAQQQQQQQSSPIPIDNTSQQQQSPLHYYTNSIPQEKMMSYRSNAASPGNLSLSQGNLSKVWLDEVQFCDAYYINLIIYSKAAAAATE